MAPFVYFIQARESGNVKIGLSQNPITRLSQLQTASPEQLDLLGVMPGDKRTERNLHRKHAQYHLRGEWFRPGFGLMADIARLLGPDQPTPQQEVSARSAASTSLAARAAAHMSWANTRDRSARTAPARAGLDRRFLEQAEGDPVRAAHLRKAYFQRLAIKSAEARRLKKG